MDAGIKEKCKEFGKFLGLDYPVSIKALEAAVQDQDYARNLLNCKNSPVFLEQLLKNPPETGKSFQVEKSNLELFEKAGRALLKWAGTGFTTVDKVVLERREQACLSCPNLKDPPDKLLYKLTAAVLKEKRICGLCGCNVHNKMQLPTESCPGIHPDDPTITRWGEPVVS